MGQAKKFISSKVLQRKTVLQLRKLLRHSKSAAGEENDGYLKLLSLCDPKTHTVRLKDFQNNKEFLTNLLETSKTEYIHLDSKEILQVNV